MGPEAVEKVWSENFEVSHPGEAGFQADGRIARSGPSAAHARSLVPPVKARVFGMTPARTRNCSRLVAHILTLSVFKRARLPL